MFKHLPLHTTYVQLGDGAEFGQPQQIERVSSYNLHIVLEGGAARSGNKEKGMRMCIGGLLEE